MLALICLSLEFTARAVIIRASKPALCISRTQWTLLMKIRSQMTECAHAIVTQPERRVVVAFSRRSLRDSVNLQSGHAWWHATLKGALKVQLINRQCLWLNNWFVASSIPAHVISDQLDSKGTNTSIMTLGFESMGFCQCAGQVQFVFLCVAAQKTLRFTIWGTNRAIRPTLHSSPAINPPFIRCSVYAVFVELRIH